MPRGQDLVSQVRSHTTVQLTRQHAELLQVPA